MNLKDAINERKSIRGFKDMPVSESDIKEMLKLAVRAISANNAQPWNFIIVTGEPLAQLKKFNMDDFHNHVPEDYPDFPISGIYKERAREVGKQLFKAMAIKRDDRERRAWWNERGYRFFDAPAVIFLYLEPELTEPSYFFDMGCATQNICLAALEMGLGTCVEQQAVVYQRGLHEILGIPKDKKIVTGIAIGYPDPDFPANQVVSPREDIERLTQWYGFDNK